MSTTVNNIESLSREFAKLVGIEWHDVEKKRWNDYPPKDCIYYCDICQTHFPERELSLHNNPDFSDAREVIRVMDEGTKAAFIMWLMGKFIRTGSISRLAAQGYCVLLATKYFEDRTGLLLKEAVEWMKGREANNAD